MEYLQVRGLKIYEIYMCLITFEIYKAYFKPQIIDVQKAHTYHKNHFYTIHNPDTYLFLEDFLKMMIPTG